MIVPKKTLYRDGSNARVAGVCAGVAEYFGLETWLVRVLTVTAFFLLAGPFVVVSYIAAWFILDLRPTGAGNESVLSSSGVDKTSGKGWRNSNVNTHANSSSKGFVNADPDERKIEIKSKVWQAGEPPKQAFHDIKNRFNVAEDKLRKIETYVTSQEFQLNREFNRL